jgi:hypothetical protein
MLTAKEMHAIDVAARKNYTYKHDPEGRDNWRSYHKEVAAGKAWSDDCDSLASTVVNLLILRGLPMERCWFAHVDSTRGGKVDHMVAFAEANDGSMWVVGDTFGPTYPARNMKHTLIQFCRVSNIEGWYRGNDYRQLKMVPT